MYQIGSSSDQGKASSGQLLGSRRGLVLTSMVLLGIAGFAGWQIWQAREIRLAQAQLEAQRIPVISTVSALGELAPQGELINLSAGQGSRVAELRVQVGDRVEVGQIIAVLDSREHLQAALKKTEEQVKITQAKLAQVQAGSKTGEIQAQEYEISRLEAAQAGDIAAQTATIAGLEAEMENARIEYKRYEYLNRQGAISASERDARALNLSTAQRQLQVAKAELARMQTTGQQQINQATSRLDQIQEVRPVDVSAAQAEVQSAIASVAQAQADLDQAYVKSPMAGQVIEILTRPGETLSEKGIVTIGDTHQMMVVAEVYQDDIVKVEPGQSVEVTTPVVDGILQGSVERVGLQVERQAVVNEDPAANIDAKIVEVHIRLDSASSEKVAGLTHLQVTASIQTE